MITVTLYTQKDCPPCEQAKTDLDSLQEQIPHRLVEIDIATDTALMEKYRDQVPVVEIGPYHLPAPFSRTDLAMTLGAARDRKDHLEKVSDTTYERRSRNGQTISGTDRFSMWMTRNWLIAVNIIFFLYVGLPFLAPTLMEVGATLPARVIYTAYSPLCHQLGFRSFFLFGPQYAYPRASADVSDLETFGQATGINENDLLAARAYVGNSQVGYKVAICERDVAIYAAIFLFGILYGLSGRRLKPLHWMLWLLLGIIPMGIDGFWQLFSNLNLPWILTVLPYHESTPLQRVLTGALFGFTTAWFGLPYIEESMRETRELLVKKFMILSDVKA